MIANMRKDHARHRVVVLALNDVIPFELSIPSRVFGVAEGPDGEPLYEVITCSVDGGPVRTTADFIVAVKHGAEVLATADTLVVPAFYGAEAIHELGRLPEPLEAALATVRPGTRMVSICVGSYVLAAMGLLDGRPATTHWHHAEHFQRLFPRVRVDPDVLFIDDGDVLTSAGAAAGVDLCLHIVRRDHGSKVTNQVARGCVVPPWREGGQAQFIERPVPAPSAAGTAHTRAWALERLHEPLPLSELAAHAQMSVRTFIRRFREEVGMPPGQWLIQQRVDRARHLLEASDLPVDLIAHQAGFATTASLRHHLHAAIGVSPMAYRRTFNTHGSLSAPAED